MTTTPAPSVALRWLRRQLEWEHTLAELRQPDVEVADDEAAA